MDPARIASSFDCLVPMYDRPGKIQVTTRTQVTDLLRELETINARKATALLLPERVVVPTPRFQAQLYFTADGHLVAVKPRGRARSSWLARAVVIVLFVVIAAACGAVILG